MITPCTNALRSLQGNINSHLGNDMGVKHANAQLNADIRCLMDSLMDHQVYIPKPGRVINYDDAEVLDVMDVGFSQLSSLASTSPLAEYNAAFRRLQKRRRMTPVTKPPSPELNVTELPDFGSRIFPGTPSPPSESSSRQPTPSPELVDLTGHGPTVAELLSEIREVQDEGDIDEPLLQGELQQIMDDIEYGVEEETLPRQSMRDVALDMDAVDSEDDDDTESSSSGSDSEYVP